MKFTIDNRELDTAIAVEFQPLSRRDTLAGMALQGLLSRSYTMEDVEATALEHADVLIALLDAPEKPAP